MVFLILYRQIRHYIFTWLVYLRNMFVPLNMSYDYNFAHVDIVPLTNFYALISIVVHLTMAVYAAINIKKQPLIAYGIIFYFISFGLVSNLLFNIGATMADRFMFIPSVGFLIALAGILSGKRKIRAANKSFTNFSHRACHNLHFRQQRLLSHSLHSVEKQQFTF